MLSYEEFKEQVTANILNYLPEKFQRCEVRLTNINQNNDTKRDAIMVVEEGIPPGSMTPAAYLDSLYEEYVLKKHSEMMLGGRTWIGSAMEDVMRSLARQLVNNTGRLTFDVDALKWENVKDAVVPRIILADTNKELLSTEPHRLIGDFAVHYTIECLHNEDVNYNLIVNHRTMERLQIQEEDLYQAALKTIQNQYPPRILDITSFFGDEVKVMTDEDVKQLPDNMLAVLTNENKMFGANVILMPGFLKHVSDVMEGELYLVPSCVHEWLIIKNPSEESISELKELIRKINQAEIEPEERLSDDLYRYDPDKDMLEKVAYEQNLDQVSEREMEFRIKM